MGQIVLVAGTSVEGERMARRGRRRSGARFAIGHISGGDDRGFLQHVGDDNNLSPDIEMSRVERIAWDGYGGKSEAEV